MPTIDMKLPKNLLKIKQFTAQEADKYFKDENGPLFAARIKSTGPAEQKTYGGVTVTFHNQNKDPGYDMKKEAVKTALEQIDKFKTQFGLPGNVLKVYCYGDKQAGVGYVLMNGTSRQATLLLGTTAVADNNSILAAQIYDYYKPTVTVNAKAKRALAVIVHELGHIFHQLHNPSHYICLGELSLLANKSQGELDKEYKDTFETHFPAKPKFTELQAVRDEIQKAGANVSSYASAALPDVVAEVFCGLMMGAPFGNDVLDVYKAMGGPTIPDGMAHVRKGQDNWFKKKIYAINKALDTGH